MEAFEHDNKAEQRARSRAAARRRLPTVSTTTVEPMSMTLLALKDLNGFDHDGGADVDGIAGLGDVST